MPEESENQSLREDVERLRAHIGELKQTLIDRESKLAMADEIYLIRRQQFDALRYELAYREQILEKILNSWFWRLTLPQDVRRVGEEVRRILRLDRKGPVSPTLSPVDEAPPSRRMQYVHRVTDNIDARKLDVKAVALFLPHLGSIH